MNQSRVVSEGPLRLAALMPVVTPTPVAPLPAESLESEIAAGWPPHHKHRHGQCRTKYCGRQAPAVATLVLAFRSKNGRSSPDRWMNALRTRKCPPAYTPNFTQPQGNPNTRHMQRRC